MVPPTGLNENLETDNLCWNVFCGQCEKILIPSHNCCCVVKKNSLCWKWPDLAQGRVAARARLPALFEKWYESKYWSVLLFFLSAIWSRTAKNWKFFRRNICCSDQMLRLYAAVMTPSCHCFDNVTLVCEFACKCCDRVHGWVFKGLVITTIWQSYRANRGHTRDRDNTDRGERKSSVMVSRCRHPPWPRVSWARSPLSGSRPFLCIWVSRV